MIWPLVVDDDFRVAYPRRSYVHSGWICRGGTNTHRAAEARQVVTELRPDLLRWTCACPTGYGLDLIRSLADAVHPSPAFRMISAARDADNIRHAVRLGAVHYPVKPFGFTQLRDRLESTWVQSIAWATHPV